VAANRAVRAVLSPAVIDRSIAVFKVRCIAPGGRCIQPSFIRSCRGNMYSGPLYCFILLTSGRLVRRSSGLTYLQTPSTIPFFLLVTAHPARLALLRAPVCLHSLIELAAVCTSLARSLYSLADSLGCGRPCPQSRWRYSYQAEAPWGGGHGLATGHRRYRRGWYVMSGCSLRCTVMVVHRFDVSLL